MSFEYVLRNISHLCNIHTKISLTFHKFNAFEKRIDDLFDRFSRVKMFSRIDLCLGYYQIQIVKGDEKKITCCTR